MGDQTVGLQARMMSQAMRKLAGNLNRTQTLCLFTNQIREKVGVMFGSPETQPGGRALKFYASQRLDIRRIETLKDGTEAVGNRVRVKVVKNKVAAPFRQAEFDIEFGKGISTSGCILDLGIEHNIVTKSGSFFSYGEDRLGQGRNNAKAFLDEHLEIAKEIENKIYAALGVDRDLVAPIEHDDVPEMDVDLETGEIKAASTQGGVTAQLSAADRWWQRPRGSAPARAGPRRIATSATVIARWPRCGGTSRPSGSSRTRSRQPSRSCCACNYLDDARFAQRFVEDRRTLDSWGADRIERKLLAAGVEPELVEAALERARPRRRARRRARGPAAPSLPGAAGHATATASARSAMLVRKGYELELAYDAVRAYCRNGPGDTI